MKWDNLIDTSKYTKRTGVSKEVFEYTIMNQEPTKEKDFESELRLSQETDEFFLSLPLTLDRHIEMEKKFHELIKKHVAIEVEKELTNVMDDIQDYCEETLTEEQLKWETGRTIFQTIKANIIYKRIKDNQPDI